MTKHRKYGLDPPLLPARTRTSTTEFLRFHPPGVCNKKGPIICHQLLLQLDCTECVDIFRIVCNNSLRNSLADRVYLRGMSTALDADTNVNVGEGIFANHEDRLVDLKSKNLRLNEVDGRPVDTDQAFAFARMRHCSCSLERYSIYNWVCHGMPSQRTFFFPKVCTALVEAIFKEARPVYIFLGERVSQLNLMKRTGCHPKGFNSIHRLHNSRQLSKPYYCMQTSEVGYKAKIWMGFTYLRSLTASLVFR